MHYAAKEVAAADGTFRFEPLRPAESPPRTHLPKGLGQSYACAPSHALDAGTYAEDELAHSAASGRYPIVV